MNIDEFENRLQRQPLRQIPAGWRNEILGSAQSAQPARQVSPVTRNAWLSTLNHQLSTLLWPHPKAWAGLAAVWVLIFIVNFSIREKSPVLAEKTTPPAPEVMVELRQQRRMLAELIGPRDAHDADRSKSFVPQPRSEFVETMAA